jgi:hypothetical protein
MPWTRFMVVAAIDAGILGTVTRTLRTDWWFIAQAYRFWFWLAHGPRARVTVYDRRSR